MPACQTYLNTPITSWFSRLKNQTNQSSKPTPIFYFQKPNPLSICSVCSQTISITENPIARLSDPLFLFESSQVVIHFWFHNHLHQIQSGISPNHYLGHSFRRWQCHLSLSQWHSRTRHTNHRSHTSLT